MERATPHSREWTRPLRVLAVQCPLHTRPITQPPVYATPTPHRRTQGDGGIYRATYSVAR